MGRIFMPSYRLKVAAALVLVTSCQGQDRGGVDSAVAVPLIRGVLRKANVSGSLAYWGQCGYHMSRPDFPKVRILSNYSGPPREVLQQIFADDPQMRVTQEPGGEIRMVETDVPSDLLDVKISHLSFDFVVEPAPRPAKTLGGPNTALELLLWPAKTTLDGTNMALQWPAQRPGGPNTALELLLWPAKMTLGGPNMALELIMSTPEVSAFKRAKNIRPFSHLGFPLPGDSGSKPPVPGELDNVTVSQALDYVLETFPGLWVYENCSSQEQDGGRTVFFSFF